VKLSAVVLLAAAIAALASCGRDAPPVLEFMALPGDDTDVDCPDPGTDADTDVDSDADTDVDTDADTDADAGADSGTDTSMEGNCPWFCADLVDEYSCSGTLNPPSAVYNPNFACASEDRICCQPVDAPGGIEYCGYQEGFTCELDCTGEWQAPTTAYFCNSALATCCENTKPLCTEVGGVCISFWDSCPTDYVSADMTCGALQSCCAPPECPWTCTEFTNQYTCSESLDPLTAVHNYEWTCYDPADICCQPLGASGGLSEACGDQAGMMCRDGCLSYEAQRTEFYCGPATQRCCEDLREPCADIGGSCEAWWTCPSGSEVNQGGICEGLTEVCCTAIDPSNTCELGGGSCVEWGVSCPLLMIPAPTVSCGTWTQMCCQWSWG
jgi:hypothetical protein